MFFVFFLSKTSTLMWTEGQNRESLNICLYENVLKTPVLFSHINSVFKISRLYCGCSLHVKLNPTQYDGHKETYQLHLQAPSNVCLKTLSLY